MRPKGLCYLSGVDWTFYTLDYLSKKSTGCGIASQAILCLNRPLDMDQIKKRLSSFIRLFPVIHGKCARAWNLAPFGLILKILRKASLLYQKQPSLMTKRLLFYMRASIIRLSMNESTCVSCK